MLWKGNFQLPKFWNLSIQADSPQKRITIIVNTFSNQDNFCRSMICHLEEIEFWKKSRWENLRQLEICEPSSVATITHACVIGCFTMHTNHAWGFKKVVAKSSPLSYKGKDFSKLSYMKIRMVWRGDGIAIYFASERFYSLKAESVSFSKFRAGRKQHHFLLLYNSG